MPKWLRGWVLRKTFGRPTQISLCSNRVTRKFSKGDFEYTIVRRDTSKPDTYSREELYCMVLIVRAEQERTGWDAVECFDGGRIAASLSKERN